MTISKDLFSAILAMDSYNREYNAGFELSSNSIGNAQIITRESLGINQYQYNNWQNSGFYAQAYRYNGFSSDVGGLGNGDTIISYRGTDNYNPNPLDTASDVWRGWKNTTLEQVYCHARLVITAKAVIHWHTLKKCTRFLLRRLTARTRISLKTMN